MWKLGNLQVSYSSYSINMVIWFSIIPSPVHSKYPPRNCGLIEDLHMFGTI